uniref:MYND-type domain-containing protein n=1 Tax=Schistosoma mansoni TaxID=6183 RepID=A0A3Q0KRA0_SCHMA
MAVYVDRNIFHIGNSSFKSDVFHKIPTESLNYHLKDHNNNHFQDNENTGVDDNFTTRGENYYREVKDWLNGDLFQGGVFDGKRNAWGCYQWDNGEKYFGTFFNDKKHGYGYYVWPNGSNYLGTFYLDKRSGYGIMRYSNHSIYEGFFLDDQRYGPGIFINNSPTSNEIDVGYWKNDRLIRLKKPAINQSGYDEFHFIKQFPQYNFYKLVNLELMFKHYQYQKSIKQDHNNQLLINEQIYHYDQYDHQYESVTNLNNIPINSTSLFIQIIQNILKQSNLPKSFQVWNMKSPLFEKFIADQSFNYLLHCMPTTKQSSFLNYNNIQQISEMMESIQNGYSNMSNLKNDEFEQQQQEKQFETSSKQDSLFDSRFKQNQTICLVDMRTYITKIAYLQHFLHKSYKTLNWYHLFKSSIKDGTIGEEEEEEEGGEQQHGDNLENSNLEKSNLEDSLNEQLFINDWSMIWNKLSKKIFKKSNKQHSTTTTNNNKKIQLTGNHECLSIKFIQYCYHGLFDKVKNLLHNKNQLNIDLNVIDSHGQFGLLGAVLTWNMKLVNLLLDFGANINQLTDDGLTVFTICLLKYYELFKEIMNMKNDRSDQFSQGEQESSYQSENYQPEQQQEQQRQYEPDHILPIITKIIKINDKTTDGTTVNGDNNEKKESDLNQSPSISFGRNYIYRVELPVLLSTTSSESMVMLRRAARLSQIRRMHLNKIKERRSLIMKSNEIRRSTQILKNDQQTPEIKNDLITQSTQSALPTFQRFTNCLTRFNTITELRNKDNLMNDNKLSPTASSKSMSAENRKSRPRTISIDRRNKKAMIDVISKKAAFSQPYRTKSPLLREAAAQELSRNPYFLASHSMTSSMTGQALDENNDKTPDTEQANETPVSRNSLDQQALLLAKQKQMINVIDLLLKRGANPNTGIRPLPALFLAVQAGDPEMVHKLIQYGADANICLRVDSTSESENLELKGIYIDEDEPPLIPSLDGLTVLHYAVLVPNEMGVKLTEILLEDGLADPNKQATLDDSFKLKSQFNTSIISGNSSEQNSGKTTPEENRINEGRTPLHLVCSREYDLLNSAIITKCLLKHNANPNLLCNGHSALSVAIATGNDPCIDALINHQNTNINQPLGDGLGSALCIACSSLFEFRRPIESRLELIKRLINKGGIESFQLFVLLKSKGIYGNVIDFTYMDYTKDTRISKTPYHALNEIEKETYNGRMQILTYLADRLREFAYSIEYTTDNTTEQINFDRNELKDKTISYPVKTASSKPSRLQSPTYLKKNSCISYSFCYECGRSVGVRLTVCSRCHRVYFCSKVCKLKSWTMRHKNECYLTPELQTERDRRSPTKVLPKLTTNKQENHQPLLNQQRIHSNLNWNLFNHLTCCTSSGEFIGIIYHPSYNYQYLLNHYMKINENGHIIIGTYKGEGNYSLI